MATYVVGDIQGCLEPLQRLLARVGFRPGVDELWSAGDLVNRGPASLETVRFARALGSSFRMVLGNHDLHYLAVAAGVRPLRAGDTLDELLAAPEADEIFEWFRFQPLAIYAKGVVLVHAGVDPRWDLPQLLSRSAELEQGLRSLDVASFLKKLFGNRPRRFRASQRGSERARAITNVLTRMRFCTATGVLDFKAKGGLEDAPDGMRAWFAHPARALRDQRICFGHWASLQGRCPVPNVEALDTGCVWGQSLTALRLEDGQRFSVPAHARAVDLPLPYP